MTAPLPPGSSGFPLLGETLTFLRDGFGFIDERLRRHGPVFRTHLLGRTAVVMAGPEACRAFIDPDHVERAGSMPPNVREIFGGTSLPLLDGAPHLARKKLVLAGFGPAALARYAPAVQARVEALFRRFAEAAGAVTLAPELKRLMIELIAENVMSLGPSSTTEGLYRSFLTLADGITALPVPLPGTDYKRALGARDQILGVLRGEVARHREALAAGAPLDDGLGRMLAAEAADGTRLDDEAAVLELHHVQLAGYIVFAELLAALSELERRPELLAELRDEVRRVAPSGPLDAEALRAMPALDRVVREVKRVTPMLPVVFGKAKRAFEHGGYLVPEGSMVLLALHATNVWEPSFSGARAFEPERFARGEGADDELVFVPHGAGRPESSHHCAGTDYATLVMSLFLAVLARGYSFEIVGERAPLDMSRVPPEPRDGLRVKWKRLGLTT
jgi:cytochrome P450